MAAELGAIRPSMMNEPADSAELLSQFAQSTAAGCYVRSLQPAEFLYMNAGLRAMLGLAADAPDPTWSEVMAAVHPDDAQRIAAAVSAPLTGPQETELRLRRADGEYRWVRVTSNPVPNGEVPPVRSVAMVEDISRRKQAEMELAESEQRFQQLANNVEIGFALFDMAEGPEFSYVNPAYLRILGLDPGSPLPSLAVALRDLLHPDDLHLAAEAQEKVRQGEVVDEEARIIRPDGQQRWIRSRRAPVLDSEGRLVRVAGTTVDVTDRKNASLALIESEQRFRQLADSVSVGFMLLSATNPPEFIYLNPALYRILGVEETTALPRLAALIQVCLHPEDRELVAAAITSTLGGVESDDEARIIRPDGQVRWVRSRRSPVFDASGAVIRVAGTTEDITDRKTAEAALKSARAEADRANAAKNEFLSRMSHELRTPLNAVLGFAQLLQLDASLTPSQSDAVGYILRGGQHLLAMINDVLDIAGIEADRLQLSLEPVQVDDVLTEAVELVRTLAADGGVELRRRATDPATGEKLHVRADRRRLRQVLLNLLSNAIKYNRPGGWVEVRCERDNDQEGEQVRISVVDNGSGIAEADMPRLFTPFDRLGQQASPVEGTGIGLALSQRLIAFMSGSVHATSAPGVGSTFEVTLPFVQPLEPDLPATASSESPHPPAISANTLLYIEDNHSNVSLMKRIVSLRPGWQVAHAGNGAAGLELARSCDPSLVVLDLHLPDMNGVDVLDTLRGASFEVPVVIASADASPGQITRLLASGVAAYITKPLEVNDVLQLLDGYSRRS